MLFETNFAFQVDSHYCIIVCCAVFFFSSDFFLKMWCYLPLGVIYPLVLFTKPHQGVCEVCVDKEHLVHPRWMSFPCSLEWSSGLWENLWFHNVHTWDGQFVTEITFSFTLQKSTFKPAALFWQHRLKFVSATVYQT